VDLRAWLRTARASAAGAMSAIWTMTTGGERRGAVELKPGDVAPDFDLPGSDGRRHRLADARGEAVVLAWFPKAFTGG